MPHAKDAEKLTPEPADRPLTRERFAALLSCERNTLRVIAAAEVGRSDAEDVVQDATITAMAKLDDFVPGTNFRAWMAAFVRYTASNHQRSEGRRRRRRLRLAAIQLHGTNGVSTPHEQMDQRLLDGLEGLTSEQRICLLLKVVMSHSYEEIGVVLGIPAATARSHAFRARQHMLRVLKEEGGDCEHS